MPLALIFVCVLVSSPVQAYAFFGGSWIRFQENASQQTPVNPPKTSPPASPQSGPSGSAPGSTPGPTPGSTPGPTAKSGSQATPPSKKPPKKKSPGKAATPSKRVVRNGSAPDPTVQISPEVSQKQASNQLQNTNQLLAATEGNLKTMAERGPNASQQSVMRQIRQYMDQAKEAADQGDPQRAHNLALKAHLLSLDLLKH